MYIFFNNDLFIKFISPFRLPQVILKRRSQAISFMCKKGLPSKSYDVRLIQPFSSLPFSFTKNDAYDMKTILWIVLSNYHHLTLFPQKMQIQRTNSLQVEGIEPNAENRSDTIIQREIHRSENQMTMSSRMRVPQFMQQTLRSRIAQGSMKDSGEADMKKSKLGSMFRSKLKEMRKIGTCQICETEMKKSDKQPYMCNCEHRFNFCESCLHHYVIYKVKTFEEVRCPREDCNALIDITTDFFKQLPADIQKGYRKLHQFYITANDPNVKLCPQENCQGLIRTTVENVMVCDKCESEFCGKCLLKRHEGDCDKHEVEFFESNLHYRQCTKCKFVIEKNQGCNHMTCRCKYQFCYVCGADWNPAHYGEHDENGQLVPVVAQAGGAAAAEYHEDPCCDCSCCEETCGDTLACIFKSPFKLVLFLLFAVLMIFIFLCRDLLVILGMFIVCIIAGLFGFSFEFMSDLQGGACVLGVIFFPIVMLIGVGMAFKEIFCDVVPDLCDEYWTLFREGSESIFSI